MVTVNLGDRFNRNGQAAVACVRLGWQVLPWRMMDGRKVPQIRAWQAGEAFDNEDDVRAWWGTNFNHSPGIVCGERSGLWVLDVDPRNGGDKAIAALIAMYGELPNDTFMVTTPGGGWHYYFQWGPEVAELRKHAMSGHAGLDVIAEGGWVAAPGSWSDAGRYELVPNSSELRHAPGWLSSLAMVSNPLHAEGSSDFSAVEGTLGADGWLQGEIIRVGATNLGSQRQALLNFTASLRRRGYSKTTAAEAAMAAMDLLTIDPAKGPWEAADVLEMLKGAWMKYAPADMDWAAGVSATLTTAAAPAPASMPGPAEQQGPGMPAPDGYPAPPPVLPPPRVADADGEPPEAIGPDHENALELEAFAKGRLLFVNGMWMTWDGRVWQNDDTFLHRYRIIVELGHRIVVKAGQAGPDGYAELIRRANRLGTVQGRDACLNYAKPIFAVDVNSLDANLDWINTPDGLVNVQTGFIRPAQPEDLVTKMTSAGYDPAARDEVWERVLADVIPNDIDRAFFQRWCGYCLTGRTSEKIILAIHGPAGSGKSTVSEPFGKAMGQYAATWQPDVIVDKSGVNVDEAMFRVRGARLVTVSEMRRGTRLNEGVVKAATGGDTVAARGLYQAGIQYRPQFKLWVHTNFVPDSSDDALIRRFAFLKMVREFTREEQDPAVKVWLEESPSAQRAILAWAVRGWQDVVKAGRPGGVGRPEHSDIEAAAHLMQSDPARRFIDECLERTADQGWDAPWIEQSALYAAYEIWCHGERIQKPLGPSKFAAAMDERGVHKERFQHEGVRITGVRGWKVVDLVNRNAYGL
jgi:P4 family phage/plasmid primase-like protien